MAITAEITNPVELRKAGVNALVDALGDVNAHNFLEQWQGIPGRDFAKWLNEQPEQSPDEMEADIMKAIEYEDATGMFAGKIVDREAARL